jgi:hypothetical protein
MNFRAIQPRKNSRHSYSSLYGVLSAKLRRWGRHGEALSGAGLCPPASGFHSDEELVPLNVVACCGRSTAGKGLVQHLKTDDLVGFHEEPVRKATTAFAGSLVSEQLHRSVEDSVIVRFEDAHPIVIRQAKHARLFDSGPDFWNRFEQCHPQPLWRVGGRPISPGNRSAQNAPDGGASDPQSSCDFGFGNVGTM